MTTHYGKTAIRFPESKKIHYFYRYIEN